MKRIFSFCIICFCIFATVAYVQIKPTTFNTGVPGRLLQHSTSNTQHSTSVYGDFEGRIPCQEISRELNLKVSTICEKRKIALTLYLDSTTLIPTIYKIRGMGDKIRQGKWHIVKGAMTNEKVILFQLDIGEKILFLYKGDDNVLFFMDKDKNFLPGNAHYSYTLNRIRDSKSWDNWRCLANRGESF